MATDFESDRCATAVERLSRPGAVQFYYHEWVPTLDGEPVHGNYLSYGYPTREQALAEAIKRVKHEAGLAFEVMIGSRSGCCMIGEIPVIVETVAEAREGIVSHAKGNRGESRREPADGEHHYFRTRRGPLGLEVAPQECETSRRYDPADPEAGMTCHYLLYREGPAGRRSVAVPGPTARRYGPSVRPRSGTTPTTNPSGLDDATDLHNDCQPDSATNDPSELEGRLTWTLTDPARHAPGPNGLIRSCQLTTIASTTVVEDLLACLKLGRRGPDEDVHPAARTAGGP